MAAQGARRAATLRVINLKVDPIWDDLRSDPRFDAHLRDMGLADKPTQTRSASEGRGPPIDTLAVLPFDNQSPDPEAGYLGDDITYSLTDSLARIRELKVRPYSSAARFKAGSTDSKTAGRELQVQAVLKGSHPAARRRSRDRRRADSRRRRPPHLGQTATRASWRTA